MFCCFARCVFGYICFLDVSLRMRSGWWGTLGSMFLGFGVFFGLQVGSWGIGYT